YKELLRFWKVSFQTIAAPILTAVLYLLIFAHVLSTRVSVYGDRVSYGVFVVTLAFAPGVAAVAHPLWVLAFLLLGSLILATLGVIAGIWADKFDQLAAFQNFIIVPLTFLSGVFYSIHSLP